MNIFVVMHVRDEDNTIGLWYIDREEAEKHIAKFNNKKQDNEKLEVIEVEIL